MRVVLGIAISLPIAAMLCVVYLAAVALEALRDGTRSRRGARGAAPAREAWSSLARVA